jgi:hypothetical protein
MKGPPQWIRFAEKVQTLNRTVSPCNKAFKPGMAPGTTSLSCEEPEAMEHLLYAYANY